jgi:coenzyme F420-reducing hydrogenase beta subunit
MQGRELLTVYDVKENCVGCAACADVCSVNAIVMVMDKEGFSFPAINHDMCIKCGECKAVCQIYSPLEKSIMNRVFYAVQANDKTVALASSSGGMFTLLSDFILALGGCIFGVAWDEKLYAIHRKAETPDQRNEMRRSKYLQSSSEGIFKQVARELKDNRCVFFTGTPCQCSGLFLYLKAKHISNEKLYICDNICHGAPSPAVFQAHLEYMTRVTGKKIVSFDFRPKDKKGWGCDGNKIVYSDGTIEDSTARSQAFMKLFLSHYVLRPACSICQYSSPDATHLADITLGDFWGIQYIRPELYNKNGVSAVIVRTEKGQKLLNAVRGLVTSNEVTKDELYWDNHQAPAKVPSNRGSFFDCFLTNGYECAITKYAGVNAQEIVKSKFKDLLRPIVNIFRVKAYKKAVEKMQNENRNNYINR